MRKFANIVVCCLCSLLLACGGGGGGGGGSGGGSDSGASSSAAAAPTETLTVSNQDAFAYLGLESASAVIGMANGEASLEASALANDNSTVRLMQSLALQRLQQNLTLPGKTEGLTLAPLSTTYCAGGGSYSSTLSGSVYRTVYSNCIQNGAKANGVIVIELLPATSGDAYRMRFENFVSTSTANSSESVTMMGSLDVHEVSAGLVTTTSISNGNLSMEMKISGQSVRLSFNGLRVTTQFNGLVYTSSAMNMSLTASVDGDAFTFGLSVQTPVVTSSTGAYTSGKLKITGKNSALYLTLLGAGAVRLELDSNGDGFIDYSKLTTLKALSQI